MKAKNTVTAAYNQDWQKKSLDAGRLRSQRRVRHALHKLFTQVLKAPFTGDVLDLGCGDGALVNVLNEWEGVRAQGIDIGHGVNFETDALPYPDKKFDIILMYSVIEHVYNPGNLLTEVTRILKPGGKLVVITSNYDQTRPLVYDRGFYEDPTHVHPYNPTSIDHLMRLYKLRKRFIGVWTIPKTSILWKMPPWWQFTIGALLPFQGTAKYAPFFLKGRSKTMLCVFQNDS
jgi:ubiquinone/menaquinone biosynthesis C-methylase UbiE